MTTPTESTNDLRGSGSSIESELAAARLRKTLEINSGFSVATGIIGLIAGGPVADFLGVDQVWLIRLLGIGLLGFAAIVFAVSRAKTSTLGSFSQIISFNDFGWVVGTIAVIALGWLSTGGAIVMGLIGVVVLELGITQMRARSKMLNV